MKIDALTAQRIVRVADEFVELARDNHWIESDYYSKVAEEYNRRYGEDN